MSVPVQTAGSPVNKLPITMNVMTIEPLVSIGGNYTVPGDSTQKYRIFAIMTTTASGAPIGVVGSDYAGAATIAVAATDTLVGFYIRIL